MGEKRKPGRPATGQKPQHTVRMSDERWNALGEKAEQARTDRGKVLNELSAWYVGEDDAELPERPDA